MECVIYTRVSLDRTGEALAVTRQEQECRALAERLGLDVTAVYSDNDISATNGKTRPDFEAMLAAKPEAILAWHQDRLLRLTRDLERVIGLNVPVYTVTAGTLDLTTPAGRAVARTVAAWSQYEGEQKATRQVSANLQRAANGIHQGRVGYGYRRDGATVALHDDEAATIRAAAQRVLDGEPLRTICKSLNAQGVPSPRAVERIERAKGEVHPAGPLWTSTTLKQVLLRPSLAGLTVHRGKVMGRSPNDSPRVIDEDTHDRLKAALTDPARRSNHVGPEPKHLLSGIARCGRCGGAMRRQMGHEVVSKRTGRTKRQPPSYACSECFRVRRRQDLVDELVEAMLISRLGEPDALAVFATGDPSRVEEARKNISAYKARLALAADDFADGAITGDQLKRITAKLRASIESAQAVIAQGTPHPALAELAGPDVAARWYALRMDVRRQIVDLLAVVTILPTGPGRAFDPESIAFTWKTDDAVR